MTIFGYKTRIYTRESIPDISQHKHIAYNSKEKSKQKSFSDEIKITGNKSGIIEKDSKEKYPTIGN